MLERIEHDSILELRLARPPANALRSDLLTALRQAVEQAPGDGVEALVLSGAPGMFSAGLDVPHLLTLDRAGVEATFADLFALLEALARSPVPVAAAVTGHSPAGGAIMVLYCDVRIMAEGSFRIGLNEVEVGLPLPWMVAQALGRLVGAHRANLLLSRGELVDAAEALRLGWVDELAPPEGVVERALAWCRETLALPREAMLRTREVGRQDLVATFGELDEARHGLAAAWFTDETQTALRALVARLSARRS